MEKYFLIKIGSSKTRGLFSYINHVVATIKTLKDHDRNKPCLVKLNSIGYYQDKNINDKDVFEYCFYNPANVEGREEIAILTPGNIKSFLNKKKEGIVEMEPYLFKKTDGFRKSMHNALKDVFILNEETEKEINDFMKVNEFDENLVCVHRRATDIGSHAKIIDIKEHFKAIDESGYSKIFLSCDNVNDLERFKEKYGNKLFYYESQLVNESGCPYKNGASGFDLTKEAVINAILLSKGKLLIKTISNLSDFSSYYNPNNKVINLQF